MILGAQLAVPRVAQAQTGNSFLETIGISVAVGTVLGASTLPFYDRPEDNLLNLAFGASGGVAVGLGAYLVGLVQKAPGDGYEDASYRQRFEPRPTRFISKSNWDSPSGSASLSTHSSSRRAVRASPSVWMPLVSLTW